MNRNRGPSMTTLQEYGINDPFYDIDNCYKGGMKTMRNMNSMVIGLRNVFKYLEIKDRVTASRVCSSWNMISKDNDLWKCVNLRNTIVNDWEKCIQFLNQKGSTSLNCRRMLLPKNLQDLERFWTNFTTEIYQATTLRELELYRCPINVVHECIQALPQLSKLNATSIKNLYDANVVDDYGPMPINLIKVNQMFNLTHLSIKGLAGIKLEQSLTLTFENLTKLHTLSLTSIKSFPKDICLYLGTVTTSLVHLEIGDCEYIPDDFPALIQRFANLKMLRLENCCGMFNDFAKEVFVAIRSLKNLKILELVNIEFTDCVKEELANCTALDSLLIIPLYMSESAGINRKLIDCLKKHSKNLKYLVWGVTHELLENSDIFIKLSHQNGPTLEYNIDTFRASSGPFDNIPILGRNQGKDIVMFSVDNIIYLLKRNILNAKIKIIKVPSPEINQIHIQDHFDEISCVLNKTN